jgi:hypothetical protein
VYPCIVCTPAISLLSPRLTVGAQQVATLHRSLPGCVDVPSVRHPTTNLAHFLLAFSRLMLSRYFPFYRRALRRGDGNQTIDTPTLFFQHVLTTVKGDKSSAGRRRGRDWQPPARPALRLLTTSRSACAGVLVTTGIITRFRQIT